MMDRVKQIEWKWWIAAGSIGVACALLKLFYTLKNNNKKDNHIVIHPSIPITVRANSDATTSIYSQFYFDKEQ